MWGVIVTILLLILCLFAPKQSHTPQPQAKPGQSPVGSPRGPAALGPYSPATTGLQAGPELSPALAAYNPPAASPKRKKIKWGKYKKVRRISPSGQITDTQEPV